MLNLGKLRLEEPRETKMEGVKNVNVTASILTINQFVKKG